MPKEIRNPKSETASRAAFGFRFRASVFFRISDFGFRILLPLLAFSARAADFTPDGLEFFEKRIRPVLVERCYKCHSAGSEKLKGELHLDSRDGALKGWPHPVPKQELLVNGNAPALDRGGWFGRVGGAELIIIDLCVAGRVPNLDPEFVRATTAVRLTVDGSEDEIVFSSAVEGAAALILGFGSGDDQPLVAGAVEIQIGDTKTELGLTSWYFRPLLVF